MNTETQRSSTDTRSPGPESGDSAVEAFIERWSKSGASERANYQLFLSQLCSLLGVPLPNPSVADDHENAYVFERRVPFEVRMQNSECRSEARAEVEAASSRFSENRDKRQDAASTHQPKRQDLPDWQTGAASTFGYIDLYRRGCFVLETKQGVERKAREALSEAGREREARQRKGHGFRGTAGFDQVLLKAKNQADRYIRNLPASEGRPPFLIVVDVGHTIELYAEFTRTGGIYSPFPPGSHRIHLADLRRPEIRERLRLVWQDPLSLDPARRTAAVTREIAARLAALAKSLEADGHEPKLAAEFLMRCIFTMFAEDVELLPKGGFGEMLKSLRGQVQIVPSMLEQLWKAMDEANYEVRMANGCPSMITPNGKSPLRMSNDLKQRMRTFALDAICLCADLPHVLETRNAIGQVIRSSNSVAANYRAACRGKSTADFISKLGTVEEEADESEFWLGMLRDIAKRRGMQLSAPALTELERLEREAGELLAITISSRKTARRNVADKKLLPPNAEGEK